MAYSSSLSAFTFDATTIPAVGNIAFSLQRTPLDVTSIGAWNTYFIDGVASAAFTLDVFFSHADHNKLITDVLNPASSAGTRSASAPGSGRATRVVPTAPAHRSAASRGCGPGFRRDGA